MMTEKERENPEDVERARKVGEWVTGKDPEDPFIHLATPPSSGISTDSGGVRLSDGSSEKDKKKPDGSDERTATASSEDVPEPKVTVTEEQERNIRGCCVGQKYKTSFHSEQHLIQI